MTTMYDRRRQPNGRGMASHDPPNRDADNGVSLAQSILILAPGVRHDRITSALASLGLRSGCSSARDF